MALQGQKLSRKSVEEIQGYRSLSGMENPIWNQIFDIEGHVDLIHEALLPCAVFSGWPPELHQEHR